MLAGPETQKAGEDVDRGGYKRMSLVLFLNEKICGLPKTLSNAEGAGVSKAFAFEPGMWCASNLIENFGNFDGTSSLPLSLPSPSSVTIKTALY